MDWQGLHQEAVKKTMRGTEREEADWVMEDHSSIDSMGRRLSTGLKRWAEGTVPLGEVFEVVSVSFPELFVPQFPLTSQQEPSVQVEEPLDLGRRPAFLKRSRNHFTANIRKGTMAE